jgi:YD repeat-containing protein
MGRCLHTIYGGHRTGAGVNMTYNYSSNKNNGQITSSADAVSGETVTYKYDALKRLASASGANWGETYMCDGYGNLTQMAPTGTVGAPSLSVTEVENSNGNSYYEYDSDNRRIYYKNVAGAETIYFYGVDGKKLATYTYFYDWFRLTCRAG